MENKSKNGILIFLLVISIIVIGIMSFFIYKLYTDKLAENDKVTELNNKVTELKRNQSSSEYTVSNSVDNTDKNDNNTSSIVDNKKEYYSLKDIVGNYKWETTDKDGNTFEINLCLSNDGTFGCFYEVGGETGSYSIEGNTITLNEIFLHSGGVGLEVVKSQKTFTINEDGSLTTKDIKRGAPSMPESVTMKKVSSDFSDFDIRNNIKGSYGTGPEHVVTFDY